MRTPQRPTNQIRVLLRESLPELIGGLALLLVTTLVSGLFRIETRTANRLVLVVCYLLLASGAGYVWLAKRPGVLDPGRKYPRYGKLMRAISALAVLVATVPFVWSFIPFRLPPLQLRVVNYSPTEISISDRGEFMLWLVVPAAEDKWITTGWLKLQCELCGHNSDGRLTIPTGTGLPLRAEVVHADAFQRYWNDEDMILITSLRSVDGLNRNWDSPIPFTQDAFRRYFVQFEFD
jgi:hypothetical protein